MIGSLFYTNRYIISLRKFLKYIGIHYLLRKFARCRNYERAFNTALQKNILPDYVVWDVGANVGLYSEKFSEWACSGQVFAFEPMLETAVTFKKRLLGRQNVTLLNFGLGEYNATMYMSDGADENNVTAKIVDAALLDGKPVKIFSGDYCVEKHLAKIPNVIKIDVEGFELEVLFGMSELLSKPDVKGIFIEIHFSLLNERRMMYAPAKIVEILTAKGFKVRWVDSSHLAAFRQ